MRQRQRRRGRTGQRRYGQGHVDDGVEQVGRRHELDGEDGGEGEEVGGLEGRDLRAEVGEEGAFGGDFGLGGVASTVDEVEVLLVGFREQLPALSELFYARWTTLSYSDYTLKT